MKYLILGAGPAGLSFACRLKQLGENDFIVLEKETEVGGLCRSNRIDGSPIDTGGWHFLDVRNPNVTSFLFGFMPQNEWNMFERNSQIKINNRMINHPIEANIWQMDIKEQVQYLKSIAQAGCNIGKEKPPKFIEWIYWKLGDKIAEDYMIPYNEKMFGKYLSELGTYWLDKLPNVSFEETLLSCLEKKAYGKQPGHAFFYYPKAYGYGELWRRMAESIKGHVILNSTVKSINFKTHTVFTDKDAFQSDTIISTIPWKEYEELFEMPAQLQESIKCLQHSAVQIEYFDHNLATDAHWIYYPNPEVKYHRILVRHNFCPNSKGYWTETNFDRVSNGFSDHFIFKNDYAYPINTVGKPIIMKNLLGWAKSKRIFGLGRWGEHQHYNSDVTVEKAIKLAENLVL